MHPFYLYYVIKLWRQIYQSCVVHDCQHFPSADALFVYCQGEESKEDFSDLPPNQQRKALNRKIDEFKKEIARETAER